MKVDKKYLATFPCSNPPTNFLNNICIPIELKEFNT